MSVSGSTKTCPRCNTQLPARMTFCDACGLQFVASDDDLTPSSGQGSPARWPEPRQPGYSSAGQSGPGSTPFVVAERPRKGRAGKRIALVLVVLIVLMGSGSAAWFLYLSPSHLGSPFFDRHGLPGSVPLPNGIAFAGLKQTKSARDPQTNVTISADTWGWTVSGSDAPTVQQFYQANLPKNDWTNVKLTDDFDSGRNRVTACQGSQVLLIIASNKNLEALDTVGHVTATITAPGGGSALLIEVINSPRSAQVVCTDTSIP